MGALLLAAGWAKNLAAPLLDHWRIYAVVALLLAYGWHRHVVEQRDDARHDLQATEQEVALAAAVNANNVAELRRVTDSLAQMHARISAAENANEAAGAQLDRRAQMVTKEIIRHAVPDSCPASPGLRAALDGLRTAPAGHADGSPR